MCCFMENKGKNITELISSHQNSSQTTATADVANKKTVLGVSLCVCVCTCGVQRLRRKAIIPPYCLSVTLPISHSANSGDPQPPQSTLNTSVLSSLTHSFPHKFSNCIRIKYLFLWVITTHIKALINNGTAGLGFIVTGKNMAVLQRPNECEKNQARNG